VTAARGGGGEGEKQKNRASVAKMGTKSPQAISGLPMLATTRRKRTWTLAYTLFAALVLLEGPAWGQPTDVPSIQDVKEFKARFQAERQKLLRDGAAKGFAHLMGKAEEAARVGGGARPGSAAG
jgi:hypothetical protein